MFKWIKKLFSGMTEDDKYWGPWFVGKWCPVCQKAHSKQDEVCDKCGRRLPRQLVVVRYEFCLLPSTGIQMRVGSELHPDDVHLFEPHIPKTDPPDPPDPPPSRLEDCLSFAGFDAGHNRVNIENERRTANDCEQIRIANLYISRITQHIDRTIAEVKGFITDKKAFIVPTHINTGKDPKEMKANLILAIRHLEDARMRMGRVIHYLYHPFITTDGNHPHRPKVMPSLADKGYSPTGEPHKPTTDTDIANLPELPPAPPIRIINENDRPSRDFDMEAKDAPME